MKMLSSTSAPTKSGSSSILDEIKIGIKELNELINRNGPDRDINRINEIFDQLTGKPAPRRLLGQQ